MKALKYWMIPIVIVVTLGISFAISQTKQLAKVDDFVITDGYFKQRLSVMSNFSRKQVLKDREKFLDGLIKEELLIREAKKMNLQESEDYKFKMEIFSRELLTEMYLDKYLKEKNTEEAQRKYYENNKEKYSRPEMVRISVIRTKTEEQAKEVLEKAKTGEDFGKLAEKHSLGPAATKGGDLGFRDRKTLRKEHGDLAFSMKKDEIQGPIKLEDGYHIVKLTERRDAGTVPFEDAKKRIVNEYALKLTEEKIADLKKAAKISIDSAELKNLTID